LNAVPMLRSGRQSFSRPTRPEACVSSVSAWPLPRSPTPRPTSRAPAVLAEPPFFGTPSSCVRIGCGRCMAESQAAVGRKSLPPATVLGYSCRSDLDSHEDRLSDAGAETAKTAETVITVHPEGETAKIRAGLQALLCWHCLQDSNFFQYGAQNFAGACSGAIVARSPIAIAGAAPRALFSGSQPACTSR
jgi:hypothetical protein